MKIPRDKDPELLFLLCNQSSDQFDYRYHCKYWRWQIHCKSEPVESKASLSGRVRDSGAKEVLKKQLQGLTDGLPDFMDLATGRLTSKKPKKEKSPEEEVMANVKKLSKKLLGSTRYSGNIWVWTCPKLGMFNENKRLGAISFWDICKQETRTNNHHLLWAEKSTNSS